MKKGCKLLPKISGLKEYLEGGNTTYNRPRENPKKRKRQKKSTPKEDPAKRMMRYISQI